MSRRRPPLLLALWLALHLLLGQQLALAHMLGHLGEAIAANAGHADTAASDEDREHGGAEALTHVCVSCAAGFAPGLPAAGAGLPFPRGDGPRLAPVAVSPAPTFTPFHAYIGRAPPRLQN
jgi:hypothetical protein